MKDAPADWLTAVELVVLTQVPASVLRRGVESGLFDGLACVGLEAKGKLEPTQGEWPDKDADWVWALPVEAWPEDHFLAALALRLDP